MWRPGRLAVLSAVASALLVGVPTVVLAGTAAPAAAHGADAPAATDYRIAVTGTEPAIAGVTVRVVEAGARLELTNQGDRPVEVLGYDGEPYLEIRPDGVYQNRRSPTAYRNETLAGDTPVPADADSTAPPDWRRISTEPVVRWHDQRTYWLADGPPEAARAAPDRSHRVRDWTVPLRVGVTPVALHGTLDWVPPPDPVRWWGGTTLGAVLLLSGLLVAARRGPRTAHRLSAVGLAVGGATAVGYVGTRAMTAGSGSGFGGVLDALLAGPVWALVTGVAALAAAGYAVRRRPGVELALALSGACLAIFAGAANAAVFARGIAPVPGPGWWPRVAVAVIVATGTAVGLGAVLRLRAEPAVGPVTRPGDVSADSSGDSSVDTSVDVSAGSSGSSSGGGELVGGEQRVEADR